MEAYDSFYSASSQISALLFWSAHVCIYMCMYMYMQRGRAARHFGIFSYLQ